MIHVDDLLSGTLELAPSDINSGAFYAAYDRAEARRYWQDGLPDFGHRFTAMQQLIRGMLRDSEDYGFAEVPPDPVIGRTFADWLARWGHHSRSWLAEPSLDV